MERSEDIKNAHILVVDDEPANVLLLERVLGQGGYRSVVGITDSREVAVRCAERRPDIVLLDLMMPHLDGFQVMEFLSVLQKQDTYLPVLVLTADVAAATKRRALASGATDFVTKPFDHLEVLLRVQNRLQIRLLNQQLQRHNQSLEERVRERTAELEQANTGLENSNAQLTRSKEELEKSQIEILERLARAAEYRDDDTGQHTQRVGELAEQLAGTLGVGQAEVEIIRCAAPLHDVGKIGISDTILLKPGRLTPEEFDIMKTHTTIGGALLANGQSPAVQTAQVIALTHHERWDGSGYPNGLSGDSIPLEGRILSVVDVFDALIHDRPYKKAWPEEEALQEIQNQQGRQFDPEVVHAFMHLRDLH